MMRIHGESQHPAAIAQRLQNIIGLVAQRRVPEGRVGVCDGDGSLGNLDGLQRRTLRRMAHVHHQTNTIHFPDDLLSHAGDPRVVVLIAAGRQQALVVVTELHEAGAKLVADSTRPMSSSIGDGFW